MLKPGRPYTCLAIEVFEDFTICIPFRSRISHNYAYLFTSTKRSKESRSGLDYTKMVLVNDKTFYDKTAVVVDHDEYLEAIAHMEEIANNVTIYINQYVDHIIGSHHLHPREFDRRYKYSTLKYFHGILKINV